MRSIVSFALVSSLTLCGFVIACSGSKSNDNGGDKDASTTDGPEFPGFGDGGNDDGGPTCVPNPANYDIPGNNCDDDGDGIVDNPPTCDAELLSGTGGTAEDFAKALGICTRAAEKGYGLVSATFTKNFGLNDLANSGQHGMLAKFGDVFKPREGSMLGVLSSGWAMEYNNQTGTPGSDFVSGQQWDSTHQTSVPPGFPKPAAGCPVADTTYDAIDLKLEIKAPLNAGGLQFDFNFFSSEWPRYICSNYNDSFIAYLNAKGFNDGQPDNISFDKDGNPVSVNNGFFDRCTPNVEIGCSGANISISQCPGGDGDLAGTGFGTKGANGTWCSDISTDGGATGWLTSKAPVEPGETFTLDFIIWDTGDAILDSSVLLDNFRWVEGKVTTGTDRPPK